MRTIQRAFALSVLLVCSSAALAGPGEQAAAHAPIAQLGNERVTQTPLLAQDVLSSSATSFPAILESLAREAAARGDQLAAAGAFDLVFKADGFDRVNGYWTGRVAKTELRQPLAPLGAELYGGYRLSDGAFPIYEDGNFTNSGGEMKIGALFSLLRDRSYDERRYRVEDARLAASQAELDVLLTKLGVQLKALNAYWRWVGAGRELQVYRDLLQIAEARAAGLEAQVSKGAQPQIAMAENQQNIIKRQSLVAQAERNFAIASKGLSFYLRDKDGALMTPGLERLPHADVAGALPFGDGYRSAEVLAGRPELRQLQIAIERAQNKVRLGENNLKPSLDVNVEVSRDFGEIAEGGVSRDSTDAIVGLRFSVPFQRRAERGRLQRAEAELRAARLRAQRTQEQISIELDNLMTDLSAAIRLEALAKEEVRQAGLLVEAERRRFQLGASDFFLVNLREERAADAQIRALRAGLNGRLARASFDAASINLGALGLGEGPGAGPR